MTFDVLDELILICGQRITSSIMVEQAKLDSAETFVKFISGDKTIFVLMQCYINIIQPENTVNRV
jgi:hypothetical protein